MPKDHRRLDIFISHAQRSGQDQAGKLNLLLCAKGAEVWYDMQAQDLTATGMEEGVSQSRNLLIFLSDGYMSSQFCNLEVRWEVLAAGTKPCVQPVRRGGH